MAFGHLGLNVYTHAYIIPVLLSVKGIAAVFLGSAQDKSAAVLDGIMR